MVDSSVIRGMLDEFRFEEAESLLDEAGEDPEPGMREEIDRRRAEAEERARTLAGRIIELGDDREFAEIAQIAHDPSTQPLIGLLPETSRKRPDLYVREALRWEEKRQETNARRLGEARKALDGLDLELARGLMNRIDGRFLSEQQEEERDQLLLDISARALELESLSDSGDQLIDEKEDRHRDGRQPWWRRWFG